MNKQRKYFFMVLFLLIIYGAFLFIDRKLQHHGQSPTIEVSSSVLRISVKDKESVLLNNVKATDKEDGDLTSEVYIESISSFQNDQIRTVTYAVIDSDDNLTRATRQIQYTDYQKPELTLTKALCLYYIESDNALKDYVKATSSVDGDISSKISIDKTDYTGDDCYVTYSVSDSCGVKTSLKAKVTFLSSQSDIDIYLTDYFIKVKKGEEISPREYLDKIEVMGIKDNSLKSSVTITDDYDASKEGTYEFLYRLKYNDQLGFTKLIVIVEGDENE